MPLPKGFSVLTDPIPGQVLSLAFKMLMSHTGVPGWIPSPGPGFLLMLTLGHSGDGSRDWVPATHMGGLGYVPGSGPGLALPLQALGE